MAENERLRAPTEAAAREAETTAELEIKATIEQFIGEPIVPEGFYIPPRREWPKNWERFSEGRPFMKPTRRKVDEIIEANKPSVVANLRLMRGELRPSPQRRSNRLVYIDPDLTNLE
jgi:hypothetical protein